MTIEGNIGTFDGPKETISNSIRLHNGPEEAIEYSDHPWLMTNLSPTAILSSELQQQNISSMSVTWDVSKEERPSDVRDGTGDGYSHSRPWSDATSLRGASASARGCSAARAPSMVLPLLRTSSTKPTRALL